MRALAAIIVLAVCSLAHTTQHHFARAIDSLIGDNLPARRLLTCGRDLGASRCINAFSVWRAKQAHTQPTKAFNLTEDVVRFPWTQYANVSDEQLYSQLCDETQSLLQQRALTLDLIPGYTFELESNGSGKLNIDVYKSHATESGRSSMKKFKKTFYKIVPFLMLPGLLMSAILPFILPAMKMMTVVVGMMNNMALVGAVFTLLRNNAFNDKYNHKVIYVNEGYKNEGKHAPILYEEDPQATHEHFDIFYQPSEIKVSGPEHAASEDFDNIEEVPTDSEFVNQYYGGKFVNVLGNKYNKANSKSTL